MIEEAELEISLPDGRTVAMHWDEALICYVGACPACAGRLRLHSYDDGVEDGYGGDDALECGECGWSFWI